MNQLFNLVAAKDLTSGQVATHLSTLRSSEQLRGIVELDLPETVPPTSFSINFGGSGGVFFGLALLQSITFDLHEWQPGSGKAIYTGSTSIGGSVGVELGVSAGGSVSANWFRAQDAGGWYVGSGGGFVAVGGVTAAYASTSAGIALTFGLAGGLNIGVSIDGGYTLLEGQGTYDLRGGPSVPPSRPTARDG